MSRRHTAEKREIQPDPKFGDYILAKFINSIMVKGKKSIAEHIVYQALDKVQGRGGRNAIPEQGLVFVEPCAQGCVGDVDGFETVGEELADFFHFKSGRDALASRDGHVPVGYCFEQAGIEEAFLRGIEIRFPDKLAGRESAHPKDLGIGELLVAGYIDAFDRERARGIGDHLLWAACGLSREHSSDEQSGSDCAKHVHDCTTHATGQDVAQFSGRM